MQCIYGFLKLDRIYDAISIAVVTYHDFQNTSSTKADHWNGVGGFLPFLSEI